MKMRTLKLNSNFFLEAIQGKALSFASNLPSDVQLLDLKFDLCSNQVFAVIRSDSFEDIAELYPIPEYKIACTKTLEVIAQQASTMESVTKNVAHAKIEPMKKPQAQSSQLTCRMEQEFTPEQRRLLSFRAEGDCVMVKPTQFLKAEWNDINEVVKSLGGRWVKGDIISYWEIPAQ